MVRVEFTIQTSFQPRNVVFKAFTMKRPGAQKESGAVTTYTKMGDNSTCSPAKASLQMEDSYLLHFNSHRKVHLLNENRVVKN